jgi:hypothetical protein
LNKLVSNYTVFIKVHAILPKSRRMPNKLLENCLKIQLVGFLMSGCIRL